MIFSRFDASVLVSNLFLLLYVADTFSHVIGFCPDCFHYRFYVTLVFQSSCLHHGSVRVSKAFLCSRSKETPHIFLSYFHGVSFMLDPSLVENLLSCVCETNLIFSKPATKLSECFSAGVDDPHLPYANLKASPAFFPVSSGLSRNVLKFSSISC